MICFNEREQMRLWLLLNSVEGKALRIPLPKWSSFKVRSRLSVPEFFLSRRLIGRCS